jgi:hypothetical protein
MAWLTQVSGVEVRHHRRPTLLQTLQVFNLQYNYTSYQQVVFSLPPNSYLIAFHV